MFSQGNIKKLKLVLDGFALSRRGERSKDELIHQFEYLLSKVLGSEATMTDGAKHITRITFCLVLIHQISDRRSLWETA